MQTVEEQEGGVRRHHCAQSFIYAPARMRPEAQTRCRTKQYNAQTIQQVKTHSQVCATSWFLSPFVVFLEDQISSEHIEKETLTEKNKL